MVILEIKNFSFSTLTAGSGLEVSFILFVAIIFFCDGWEGSEGVFLYKKKTDSVFYC